MLCKCSGKYIDIYFILKITYYTGANNSSRGFAGKYTSRRFLNISVVEQSITLDGRPFHTLTTRLKKKVFCRISLKSLSNNFISIISGYV